MAGLPADQTMGHLKENPAGNLAVPSATHAAATGNHAPRAMGGGFGQMHLPHEKRSSAFGWQLRAAQQVLELNA